jgi:PAS domain S-box-containing protein
MKEANLPSNGDWAWIFALPVPAAVLDAHSRVLAVNRRWADAAPVPGENLLERPEPEFRYGGGPGSGWHATVGPQRVWTARPFSGPDGADLLLLTQALSADVAADYQMVVEHQSEMICRFLPDTTLTFVNRAYGRYFNRSAEQLLGRPFLDLVPEDFWKAIRTGLSRLTPESPTHSYSHEVTLADGSRGWHEWKDRAFFDSSGRAVEFLSVGRDVTDQVQAEQQVRRSEERYRATMEGGLDAFFLCEAVRDQTGRIVDFRFVDVNERAAAMVSRTREQVVGQQMLELLPLNRGENFFPRYVEVVESRIPFIDEFRVDAADQGVHATWMQRQAVPVGDGIAISARDITQRKATEEALRESEARYRGLFDRVPVAVMEQDLSEVADWLERQRAAGLVDVAELEVEAAEASAELLQKIRMGSVNRGAVSLFGAGDQRQLTGAVRRGELDLGPVAKRLKLEMIWHGRTSAEAEIRPRDLQGQRLDLLLRIEAPQTDTGPDWSRVLLTLTDVSANRQRIFAQAQVAQAENERRMLGHELHDTLGQQLTGVNMLAESLRRRLADKSLREAEEVGELARLVGEANAEVRRLISGLTPEPIGGDELETAVESLAQKMALVHRTSVNFDCPRSPDDLPEEIANHLLLIAQEAAHNAAKHARARNIVIRLDQTESGLSLCVCDDGVGMAAEAPGDPSTAAAAGEPEAGGRGLSIMRFRAEAIGAKIDIDSSPAGGTEVRCFLPQPAGALI